MESGKGTEWLFVCQPVHWLLLPCWLVLGLEQCTGMLGVETNICSNYSMYGFSYMYSVVFTEFGPEALKRRIQTGKKELPYIVCYLNS